MTGKSRGSSKINASPMIGNGQGGRDIQKPSIPSNIEDDEQKPLFNSIGYYGDLMNRLDDQISITEQVYKNTFATIQ